MKSGFSLERILVLYFPWLLSIIFKNDPSLSYSLAWLGSFFIFLITLTGWVRPLPNDLTVAEQLMRPVFLVQIIFAGYMCCTSFFFFLDVLGYQDLHRISGYFLVDAYRLEQTAECQRYYCLGHAAFVTGILIFMNYSSEKPEFRIDRDKIANLLFVAAFVTLPVSIIFLAIPGLSQFSFQFSSLSFIAGTLALAFAIPQKKMWNTVISLGLYLFNLYQALLSGYKEPIILSVVVLGIFLYPIYKKTVVLIFLPILVVLFLFLPTYNRIFRENAWSGDASTNEATQLALDAALNKSASPNDESDWDFLTLRLSEIQMFTTFIKSTPDEIGYYKFTLLEQSAIALVPRVFWPSKPITEDLVMERVYDAHVVMRGSNVSAKPAFIVDAYLSFGGFGVFIFLFLYGATAQLISVKAEKLFGGYVLGTALIFSGLFQILWRGLSFEFLINSVFWSYISMLLIHRIFVATHVLERT